MPPTALNESAWSTTPASNDGADSTIGTIANTSSPTSVDDWVRGQMAARAKARLDQGGGLVAGGTSTALTVTTNQSLSASHIANGLRLCVRTASAATGAATIAVDGLTAVDIKTNAVAAVASGDWASGAILDLVYSSTASAFIAENIGPATGFSISSITTETALDHAADFVPVYDTSATANRKFLPRYFAPSVRASGRVHKNGTSQTGIAAGATLVTWSTEVSDVGGYFASNSLTPPAGTVFLNSKLAGSSLTAGSIFGVKVYKNGVELVEGTSVIVPSGSTSGSVSASLIDQCNGTDYYEIFVVSDDASFSVSGSSSSSYLQWSMI